jgi:hypothetical protein
MSAQCPDYCRERTSALRQRKSQQCHKPTSGHLFDQNLLPNLKIFFQNAFHRKAAPFLGQKPFLDRFLREGARVISRIQQSPLPGGHACRAHLAFNKGGGGSARPPGSAPARALVLRATPGATAPKTNNPQMGVACCFGVCVSSSAASALKCTPRSVDEGRQGRRRTRCSANKDPPRMKEILSGSQWSTCGEMIWHALSVPIRCATHLEVRSPHFVVAETHCT